MTWSWTPSPNWSWDFPPYRARLSDKTKPGNDGDTVRMILDQGLGSAQEESIRLEGVFAPESRSPGGKEAAAFLGMAFSEVAERAAIRGQRWPFVIKTVPVAGSESHERRSMVRYIGTVYALDTGECLNEEIAAFLSAHPEWGRGIGGDE